MSSRIWLSCSSSCEGCVWLRGESTELREGWTAPRGWRGPVRLRCVDQLTLLLSVLLIGLKISRSSIRDEFNLHDREKLQKRNGRFKKKCNDLWTRIPQKRYVSLNPGSFVHANRFGEYQWAEKSRVRQKRNCLHGENVNEVLLSAEDSMDK